MTYRTLASHRMSDGGSVGSPNVDCQAIVDVERGRHENEGSACTEHVQERPDDPRCVHVDQDRANLNIEADTPMPPAFDPVGRQSRIDGAVGRCRTQPVLQYGVRHSV